MTDDFAWATDLEVHRICEPHYVDNDTRVVNFTLQRANQREWRGKRISQAEPQHGIRILAVDFDPAGFLAAAVNATSDLALIGPPKFTLWVIVHKPFLIADRRPDEPPLRYRRRVGTESASYARVLTHELSHAVGIPHHGDRVDNFRTVSGRMNVTTQTSVLQRSGGAMPLVSIDEERRTVEEANLGGLLVLSGECDESERMYRDGQFVGCRADTIARRGQQNSGDFGCPMRYAFADYYEAPGSTAAYQWTGPASGPSGQVNVDAWGGNLLNYRNDLDGLPAGKLCMRLTGTGINALPGHMNHSGDAGRDKPCRDLLVVNDMAARGVR